MIEISQIPVPTNHELIGFKEIKHINGDQPSLYKPVYKRVFALHGVFWDKSRSERIYLRNDTQGYTCEGELVDVNTANFELLNNIADIEMFWDLLFCNGYKINEYGVCTPITFWRPTYSIDNGFTPKSITPESPYFIKFKSFGEIFETKKECIAWCNAINKFLNRGYPELE